MAAEGKGALVAVIDTGEAGGSGVEIGSLILDGVDCGTLKIPAGFHAVLRRSQSKDARLAFNDDACLHHVGAEAGVRDENGDLLPGQAPEIEERRRGELYAKYGEGGARSVLEAHRDDMSEIRAACARAK